MIYLITGKIGGGKSLYMVDKCISHFARGGFVMGNIHFKAEPIDEILGRRHRRFFDEDKQFKFWNFEEDLDFYDELYFGTPECPVIVVCDEAHLFMSAEDYRELAKKLKRFMSFLSQSRKAHVDVYFITQDISLIYGKICKQVEHRIHCIDMRKKRMGIFGSMPMAGLKWVMKDMKSDMVQMTGRTKLDPKIFDCYDSFQMYDSFMENLRDKCEVFEPIDNRLEFTEVEELQQTLWQKIWHWEPKFLKAS